MTDTGKPLPAEVLEALQRNDQIEAIRRLRQAFDLGLKEAKDLIDAYQSGAPVALPVGEAPQEFSNEATDELPVAVIEAAQRGDKIEAIKLYREQTGAGLKEAKDAVEDWLQTHPGMIQNAPGEVPRSSNGKWWLVLFAIGVAGWYFFFRGA